MEPTTGRASAAGLAPVLLVRQAELQWCEPLDGRYHHRVQVPLLDSGDRDDIRIEGMHVHGLHDPGYPAALLDLKDHPAVLYVAGEIMRGDDDAVAVVGSRQASATAIADATAIGRRL